MIIATSTTPRLLRLQWGPGAQADGDLSFTKAPASLNIFLSSRSIGALCRSDRSSMVRSRSFFSPIISNEWQVLRMEPFQFVARDPMNKNGCEALGLSISSGEFPLSTDYQQE